MMLSQFVVFRAVDLLARIGVRQKRPQVGHGLMHAWGVLRGLEVARRRLLVTAAVASAAPCRAVYVCTGVWCGTIRGNCHDYDLWLGSGDLCRNGSGGRRLHDRGLDRLFCEHNGSMRKVLEVCNSRCTVRVQSDNEDALSVPLVVASCRGKPLETPAS